MVDRFLDSRYRAGSGRSRVRGTPDWLRSGGIPQVSLGGAGASTALATIERAAAGAGLELEAQQRREAEAAAKAAMARLDLKVRDKTLELALQHENDPRAFRAAFEREFSGIATQMPAGYAEQADIYLGKLRQAAETPIVVAAHRQEVATTDAELQAAAGEYEKRVLIAIQAGDEEVAGELAQMYGAMLEERRDIGGLAPDDFNAELERLDRLARRQRVFRDFDAAAAAGGPGGGLASAERFAELLRDPGETLPDLHPLEREALVTEIDGKLRDIEVAHNKARAEGQARANAEAARHAAVLEVQVSRGEVGYGALNSALAAGQITDAKWAQLTKALDGANADALTAQAGIEKVAAAVGGGEIPLDPKNAEDRKAVDAYFQSVVAPAIAEKDPAAQLTEIANFVGAAGIVPEPLQQAIRGRIRSGADDDKVFAADLIDRISTANPAALDDFSERDIRVGRLILQHQRDGADAATAVAQAEAAVYEADSNERTRREARLSEEKLPAAAAKWLPGALSEADPAVTFFNDLYTADAAVPDALAGAFAGRYRAHFLDTGDDEAARSLALQDIRRQWSPTRVDGAPRWMRLAPEAVYGNGLDPEWMREQLLTDLQQGGAWEGGEIEGRVRLQADARTLREAQPSYLVILQDANGAWQPVPDAESPDGVLRWRPQWSDSPARARLEAEIETRQRKAIERAIELRNAPPNATMN